MIFEGNCLANPMVATVSDALAQICQLCHCSRLPGVQNFSRSWTSIMIKRTQCVPMPWQAQKCLGKLPYYYLIGFDLIHGWLSSFVAVHAIIAIGFVLPVPVFETVPFHENSSLRTARLDKCHVPKGLPCSFFFSSFCPMLRVDKTLLTRDIYTHLQQTNALFEYIRVNS